jgi:tRNA nucleotidyltransferase (CCA-adding enzyme)
MMLLKAMPILMAIRNAGGTPFLAGGFVRDRELGIDSKDIDVEVYGLGAEELYEVLGRFGDAQLVGKSFGVVKLRVDGDEFDFALPRRELKIAEGHTGFEVESDPHMSPQAACKRRDFTWNAMLINPFSGVQLDFFGGRVDLGNRLIRHVSSEHFGEDPLRALRAFQFAGRFDMQLDSGTALLIHEMVITGRLKELSIERVWGEWEKWAVKSIKPSAGLRALEAAGLVLLYPELEALVGLRQDANHHPEGDAFRHTLHVVDAAHEIAVRDGLGDEDRIVLLLAALCHDFGKPETTEVHEDGSITTYGHDKAGPKPTKAFLERIGAPNWVVERVVPLVREHMVFRFRADFKDRTFRRLSTRIVPTTLEMLSRVMEADGMGRPPKPREHPFPDLVERAAAVGVADEAPKPILKGRHLLKLGVEPGPEMGKLIKRSFDAQLDGEFDTEKGAIEWAKIELGASKREVCESCGEWLPTDEEADRGTADGNLVVCWGGAPCDIGHSCK